MSETRERGPTRGVPAVDLVRFRHSWSCLASGRAPRRERPTNHEQWEQPLAVAELWPQRILRYR